MVGMELLERRGKRKRKPPRKRLQKGINGTGREGFYVFVHFFILSVAPPIVAVIAAVASIIALL